MARVISFSDGGPTGSTLIIRVDIAPGSAATIKDGLRNLQPGESITLLNEETDEPSLVIYIHEGMEILE